MNLLRWISAMRTLTSILAIALIGPVYAARLNCRLGWSAGSALRLRFTTESFCFMPSPRWILTLTVSARNHCFITSLAWKIR